ncbi:MULTISPECIES: epoxide hydrolase family protein [Cupriavidus]|uniref:epoxide hydrolase family protein n=1 Tax=Cupriavidus sp. DF5525 TaxID=3160989 RepID=UPI0032DFEB51
MPQTPDFGRRLFCGTAVVAAASTLGLLNLSERSHAMTKVAQQIGTDGVAIRPFHVNFPESDLAELRRRVAATRLPEKETVADFSQGVPLATVQKLARYWATEYDWRKVEARLNAVPNFITEVDGLDIHFIHVRSKHENALPVIITHGWPGSIVEQLKLIEPLTNPTAHGGTAADAFHVVIPSMPGYGFSGKPTTTGWDPAHIARAWAVLMKRLGYKRYVAQGGDWGAIIVDVMATQGHPELIGIHTNMPNVIPPEIDKAAAAGSPAPSGLSADEKHAYETLASTYRNFQYGYFMGSRPQTLYGIADSPVGVAAWMLDHDPRSLQLIARAFDGQPTGLTRDDVLDNATLFWLTNTTISAARLYWEAIDKKTDFFGPKNVSIPVAVSVFPDEIYHTPRSWAERAYPKLIHYNKLPKGGHFAAWEQPKLLSEELRTGFKSLRG